MASKTIQLVMVVAGEVPDGGVEVRTAPQSDGTPGRILPTKYVALPIDAKDFMEASPGHLAEFYAAPAIAALRVALRESGKTPAMNNEQIARVCHETNKAYCETIGDYSQRSWDDAEEWQRQSAIKGVEYALLNPNAPAYAQHDAWFADKERDGWKFGPVKDPAKKEHPCMVSYGELPMEQRIKDHLFKAVVRAFADGLTKT